MYKKWQNWPETGSTKSGLLEIFGHLISNFANIAGNVYAVSMFLSKQNKLSESCNFWGRFTDYCYTYFYYIIVE